GSKKMGTRQLCCPLDFDVRVYPDLHACVIPHRRRIELVVRNFNGLSWQPDRPYSDAPECTCRDSLWDSVSSVVPGLVWNGGRQPSGVTARARCVWVVRNSDLDWW